jgi:thioester reductase-like protein/acyl carrier protein
VILSIESGNKSSQKRQQEAPQRAGSTTPIQPATTSPSFVARESSESTFAKALSIISEESGLAVADLTDSVVFTDVGIDSLLGLTITARFQEELDLDLDFNALFFEYPTVGDLRAFVGEPGTSTSTSGETKSAASSRTSATGVTTPDRDVSPTPTVDFQRALAIISEESMVAVEELTDDTSFADSGVDSLLSLIIVSRFRDELGLDIQHESLLLEYPTVRDLKRELLGDPAPTATTATGQNPVAKSETVSVMVPDTNTVEVSPVANRISQQTPSEAASLQARKAAVDHYVNKYTAGFTVPHASTPRSGSPGDSGGKVVLITGATGSLGSNLVHHMAELPDVTKVICLNRENKADAYVRQQKAMREKGIRFPEALKPKLLVLQTNATKPMLGLPRREYEGLVNTVTHLIHNAWPMSAKRPLVGFEPQFQIMQNLINLARDAAAQRPQSFRFSFQMVSSIAVVGRYGLDGGDIEKKIQVPEERMDIDSVLPNGYGDAKWGCERMLDETLHQHPDRFRAMTVRLGQIAGSKTSGYWNPMEHFGFLIKSSQTLNALPDVEGTVYWTTVNDIAGVLSELVLSGQDPYPVYHVENPVGQSWRETNAILADALKIPNLIPFKEWVERVRAAPTKNNPASTLLDFLESNYLRLSCGGLVLGVNRTLEHSKVLSAVGPVSEEVVRKYIHIWKEIGFLN